MAAHTFSWTAAGTSNSDARAAPRTANTHTWTAANVADLYTAANDNAYAKLDSGTSDGDVYAGTASGHGNADDHSVSFVDDHGVSLADDYLYTGTTP
jgi:hypothetical protein